MKLKVTGVETIELTDPRGHCGVQNPLQTAGGIGDVDIPAPTMPSQTLPKDHPSWAKIYTRNLGLGPIRKALTPEENNEKWGLGLPEPPTPEKWEKNWQAGIGVAAQDVKAGDPVELI